MSRSSRRCNMNLEFSICFPLILCIATAYSATFRQLSNHPVVLVVSFDGFRYDYLKRAETPAIDALIKEGVSVPYMRSQFPTKTFPNHQSIATGLYPEAHGVVDNEVYDPLYQKKLSGFKDDDGFYNFRPDVLPFYIRNELAGDGRYSGCFMWAGSSKGYSSAQNSTLLPTYYIPKYDKTITWEKRVETAINWMTDEHKPANVVFLYHEQPDSTGHVFGAEASETLKEVKNADDRVGVLVGKLKAEGIYDKINVVILGDHGMQTICPTCVINITINNPDLYSRYGKSPVLQIQPKRPQDLNTIYEAFKEESKTKPFKVFKKEDNTLRYLNYGNNRRIHDIVLLANPGFVFPDHNLNYQKGTHGYDNNEMNMTTIFMARGPQFKKGYVSPKPIDNIDLFPLFSKIMGIETAPNNGSLETVGNFLVSNSVRVELNFKLMTMSLIVYFVKLIL